MPPVTRKATQQPPASAAGPSTPPVTVSLPVPVSSQLSSLAMTTTYTQVPPGDRVEPSYLKEKIFSQILKDADATLGSISPSKSGISIAVAGFET